MSLIKKLRQTERSETRQRHVVEELHHSFWPDLLSTGHLQETQETSHRRSCVPGDSSCSSFHQPLSRKHVVSDMTGKRRPSVRHSFFLDPVFRHTLVLFLLTFTAGMCPVAGNLCDGLALAVDKEDVAIACPLPIDDYHKNHGILIKHVTGPVHKKAILACEVIPSENEFSCSPSPVGAELISVQPGHVLATLPKDRLGNGTYHLQLVPPISDPPFTVCDICEAEDNRCTGGKKITVRRHSNIKLTCTLPTSNTQPVYWWLKRNTETEYQVVGFCFFGVGDQDCTTINNAANYTLRRLGPLTTELTIRRAIQSSLVMCTSGNDGEELRCSIDAVDPPDPPYFLGSQGGILKVNDSKHWRLTCESGLGQHGANLQKYRTVSLTISCGSVLQQSNFLRHPGQATTFSFTANFSGNTGTRCTCSEITLLSGLLLNRVVSLTVRVGDDLTTDPSVTPPHTNESGPDGRPGGLVAAVVIVSIIGALL